MLSDQLLVGAGWMNLFIATWSETEKLGRPDVRATEVRGHNALNRAEVHGQLRFFIWINIRGGIRVPDSGRF